MLSSHEKGADGKIIHALVLIRPHSYNFHPIRLTPGQDYAQKPVSAAGPDSSCRFTRPRPILASYQQPFNMYSDTALGWVEKITDAIFP